MMGKPGKKWRAPKDWVPKTMRKAIIRMCGDYGHDEYFRMIYEAQCREQNMLDYSDEQFGVCPPCIPSATRS